MINEKEKVSRSQNWEFHPIDDTGIAKSLPKDSSWCLPSFFLAPCAVKGWESRCGVGVKNLMLSFVYFFARYCIRWLYYVFSFLYYVFS